MPHDLKRLFPIKDLPSARLMKLKAHCLTRAGVLSDEERAMVERKAEKLPATAPFPDGAPAPSRGLISKTVSRKTPTQSVKG